MLVWNHRRQALLLFAIWVVTFLPFAYYNYTHVGKWSDQENLSLCCLLATAVLIDGIGIACLMRFIPAQAEKFSNE
jgi:hypothetical protein